MCFHLMTAYRPASGEGRLVFDQRKAKPFCEPVMLPCGGCIQCRASKARDWTVRAWMESQLQPVGCSVTLTYAPQFLPDGATLRPHDLRLFMKRVWNAFPGVDVRFLVNGEYGDQGLRPHYHLLLWGLDFVEDRVPWNRAPSGEVLYLSKRLDALWGFGIAAIGTLTVESAGYAARYCMKKITGPMAEREYQRFAADGQPFWVHPVFARMSRRPGLGGAWIDRYWDSDAKSDFVRMDGRRVPMPEYCVKRRFKDQPEVIEARRAVALQYLADHASDFTIERIAVREEVMRLSMSRLHRALDAEAGYLVDSEDGVV